MKESTEIKNLVLSMHTIHPKDLPAFAEQFWSKEPGVDWFGNAPGNYWKGYDSILGVFQWLAENMGDPLPKNHQTRIEAYEEGTVGWANWDVTEEHPDGRQFAWRESMVFHREGDKWKIVHCHSSLPVPDEELGLNEAVIRKFFDGYAKYDPQILDEVLSSDVVGHQSGLPDANLEELKSSIANYASAFSNLSFTLHDVISKADKVVVRGTTHGTHTGAFMGIQPTAKEVALPWIGIFRLVAGKIVEAWFEINDRILFH